MSTFPQFSTKEQLLSLNSKIGKNEAIAPDFTPRVRFPGSSRVGRGRVPAPLNRPEVFDADTLAEPSLAR